MGCLIRAILWIAAILLACVILAVVAVLGLSRLLPGMLESRIESQTGFPADISGLEMDLTSGEILVGFVEIRNPPDYPNARFLRVENLRVDLAWSSLLSQRLTFDHVEADVRELQVAWSSDRSESNLQTFMQRCFSGIKADGETPPSLPREDAMAADAAWQVDATDDQADAILVEGEADRDAFFRIEELRLSFGRLLIGAGRDGAGRELDLNFELRGRDVDRLTQILDPLRERFARAGADSVGAELQRLSNAEGVPERATVVRLWNALRSLFENVFEK